MLAKGWDNTWFVSQAALPCTFEARPPILPSAGATGDGATDKVGTGRRRSEPPAATWPRASGTSGSLGLGCFVRMKTVRSIHAHMHTRTKDQKRTHGERCMHTSPARIPVHAITHTQRHRNTHTQTETHISILVSFSLFLSLSLSLSLLSLPPARHPSIIPLEARHRHQGSPAPASAQRIVLHPRFELLWKRDLLSDQSVALRASALDSGSFPWVCSRSCMAAICALLCPCASRFLLQAIGEARELERAQQQHRAVAEGYPTPSSSSSTTRLPLSSERELRAEPNRGQSSVQSEER